MPKNPKYRSPSLFDVVTKFEHSSATVSELRVPIFSPIEKVSHNSTIAKKFARNKNIRTVSTSWGESTTRGRVLLGQQHRDILDCIYLNASAFEYTSHGSMRIFFSRRKVLIAYAGNESGKNNQAWLKTKLEEIRDTAIAFKNKKGDSYDFNIIKHLDYNTERLMYCIELDERYVKFYSQDLSVNYQKLLPDILSIKNSIIKTIVRFLLSHTKIKITLEQTLNTIGYPIAELSDVNRRAFIRELKKNTELLSNVFSIDFDGMFFEYSQIEQISFVGTITNEAHFTKKELLGKMITRNWFGTGLVNAEIVSIELLSNLYYVKIRFPDQKILQIDTPFSSIEEIEKIIDPLKDFKSL